MCVYVQCGRWNPRVLYYEGALPLSSISTIIKNVTINISHFYVHFLRKSISSVNCHKHYLHLGFLFCFVLFLLISDYIRSFTHLIWCHKNEIFWLLVSSWVCRYSCVAGLSSRATLSILFYTHTHILFCKTTSAGRIGYPARLWWTFPSPVYLNLLPSITIRAL